jgi:hypothetical protein
MENDFDGRKAVGEKNRERVFHYLDANGVGAVRLGYHALGMSRPTFRKHARAWCELHGLPMPRKGRCPSPYSRKPVCSFNFQFLSYAEPSSQTATDVAQS